MRAFVVACHPLTESFTEAALDQVVGGLVAGGHEHRMRELYRDGWEQNPDPGRHDDDLAWCDTLVLVYPTWWSGPPGLLTDWIARCWPNEVRRRHIRRIVAVTSHGSPRYVNVAEGEVGKLQLSRWVRPRCARRARFQWRALYAIDSCTDEARAQFLSDLRRSFIS